MNSQAFISKCLQEAIQYENNNMIEEAVAKYSKACERLTLLANECKISNPLVYKAIYEKTVQYIDHADELKKNCNHDKLMRLVNKKSSDFISYVPTEEDEPIFPIQYPEKKMEDIIGMEAAKKTLKTALTFNEQFKNLLGKSKNIKAPRCILFYGPPGTGKTLLAESAASFGNSLLMPISCSDVYNKFIGESEKNVRYIFNQCKFYSQQRNIVLFFDEVDKLIPNNTSLESSVNARVLQEFLTQVNSCDDYRGKILILGATNYPQNLDGALTRRFEKRIEIGLPSFDERIFLLKELIRCDGVMKSNMTEDQFKNVAEKTHDYSNAELQTIIQEAGTSVVQTCAENNANISDHVTITYQDVLSACKKIKPACTLEMKESIAAFTEKSGSKENNE